MITDTPTITVTSNRLEATALSLHDRLFMACTRTFRSDRLRALLKWAMALLVLAFVARRASHLGAMDLSAFRVEPAWLILAGLAYCIGWLPSVVFWRRLLLDLGSPVRFSDAARAHYCGHLGKYVPGKAAALLIRTTMVKEFGVKASIAMLTAAYESLLMMGVGTAVGILLLPLTTTGKPALVPWNQEFTTWRPYILVATALSAIAAVVIRRREHIGRPADGHPSLLSLRKYQGLLPSLPSGLLLFVLAWTVQGTALQLTVNSIANHALTLSDVPFCTAAIAIATVGGFAAVVVPGGLGVREAVLSELLATHPAIRPEVAVTSSVLLRLISLGTELLLAGTFTVVHRSIKNGERETAGRVVPGSEPLHASSPSS